MAKSEKNVIEMHDIVKTFPGVRALNHVDFELKKGEIRSGSAKTLGNTKIPSPPKDLASMAV